MRKNNFKIVSLLTVFTIVLNVLSAVVMLQPAKAATSSTISLDRLMVSQAATHTVTVTSNVANVTAVNVDFSAFTGTPVGGDSVAGSVVTFNTLPSDEDVTGLTNPGTVGSYDIEVEVVGDTTETILVNVSIVDSDQVNVNGYINTSLTFDLDTSTTDEDCDPDTCLLFATGGAGSNYTVDLGNLTTAAVNTSASGSVTHATGTGVINSIWFDLSSNAAGGVIVTLFSANERLDGPGDNDYDIASVADGGVALAANTPGYGVRFEALPTYDNLGSGGTVTQNADCDTVNTDPAATYCELLTAGDTLLSVSTSVQNLRAEVGVGAAINGTMPAGTYEDTLTFIATGTF